MATSKRSRLSRYETPATVAGATMIVVASAVWGFAAGAADPNETGPTTQFTGGPYARPASPGADVVRPQETAPPSWATNATACVAVVTRAQQQRAQAEADAMGYLGQLTAAAPREVGLMRRIGELEDQIAELKRKIPAEP